MRQYGLDSLDLAEGWGCCNSKLELNFCPRQPLPKAPAMSVSKRQPWQRIRVKLDLALLVDQEPPLRYEILQVVPCGTIDPLSQ